MEQTHISIINLSLDEMSILVENYLFKVNNKDTITEFNGHSSNVYITQFEQVSVHWELVNLLFISTGRSSLQCHI